MLYFMITSVLAFAEPTVRSTNPDVKTEKSSEENNLLEEINSEEKDSDKIVLEDANSTEVSTGEIYVNNLEEGYRIFIDGLDTEKNAPVLLPEIPVGEHQLELRTECTYQRKKIVVRENLVERAEFQLTPFDKDKPPMEEMVILSQPEGAIVVMDGVEVGNTPWRGTVTCGTHELETRIFGYLSQKTSFHASIFDQKEITVTLKPEQYGTLVVKPTPLQTKITMNGIEEGSGPMSFPDIPVGNYRVEFSADGYEPVREMVKIQHGEIETLEVFLLPEGSRGVDPVRTGNPSKDLFLSTGSIVIGSGLAYMSLSSYSQGKVYFDQYLDIESDNQANAFYDQNVLPYRNRSISFGVVAGTLYVLGSYLFINRSTLDMNSEELQTEKQDPQDNNTDQK